MGRKRKEIDREQKETTERIKKRLKPIHDKGLYSLGEFEWRERNRRINTRTIK
jgi:nucleoid DNA-binding protein